MASRLKASKSKSGKEVASGVASGSTARAPSKLMSPFAPLLATGVVVAATFGVVQTFGDARDGGPRRIVRLDPASASAAAPRLSLSDAFDPSTTLDDLSHDPSSLHDGDETAADGEVRVSMVDSDGARRPPASPLARAPIAGFFETTPSGPLPIIAQDGRKPAQAYARPFTLAPNRPAIAVIVGGLGFNARATTQAIEELPPEITLSFVPYADNLQTWIDRARAHGHEVMIELPMEPFDPDADDTGPLTLLASASRQQNLARLNALLARAAGYFAVTNYQGARFATSAQASRPVAESLHQRGVSLITTGIGQRTALTNAADSVGVATSAADRIIDVRRDAEAIDEQLLNLEALALQNRTAIGAGFAYPLTMEQVSRWASRINERGYQLAPASAILNARTAHE